MANVKTFWIEESHWAGGNGETLYYITDGMTSRGGYSTRKEAEENMENAMWDWGTGS